MPDAKHAETASTVSILIADGYELVRRGLASILSDSHPEWKIVAEVDSGITAIDLGKALRPDVAILGLSLPDVGGLQVAERLVESVPAIRCLILTMRAAAPILRQMKKTGVSGYLSRNEAPKMLVLAVERILAGELLFEVASGSSRMTAEQPEYIPVQFLLTTRELEVLRLLARGKTTKELASILHIGVRTVETHRAHLLAKLHVDSLGELVRIAIRDGVT